MCLQDPEKLHSGLETINFQRAKNVASGNHMMQLLLISKEHWRP